MIHAGDKPGAILVDLAQRGIRLQARGDRLRLHPRSAMTPGLIGRVKAHKAVLLAILRPVDEREPCQCPAHRPCPAEWPTTPIDAPEAVVDLATARMGWTPDRWAARLRQLAEACEATDPTRAGELRTAAGLIDKEYRRAV